MRRKILSILLCVAMVATLAVGCSSSGGGETSGDDGKNEESSESGGDDSAGGGYKFAILVPTMNHEYFENCVEFSEQCAKELGCTVDVYSADNNADTMNKNVEDAMAAGIDGILIDPYYASGTKCAEMCEAQGIPMIAFDSDIEEFDPQGDYKQYISFIGPDDADAGYNMACNLFENAKPDADGTLYVGVV